MASEIGDDSLASEFRRQFLEELGRRNLTMADVARAYGCSNENIAQLVGGGRDLRLGTADSLCQAIGVHLTIQIEE
jgi:plasmid maintenance system antidote protein VapI